MDKKCKCGYDATNDLVTHKTEYSGWGWFLFTVLGMSAKPKSVSFICTQCGEELKNTSDPKILAKYVGR
jgi:hypothetical protein